MILPLISPSWCIPSSKWSDMEIAFTAQSPALLRGHGLDLPLSRTQTVSAQVAFEPPCVVQCHIDVSGPLQVGAFTGIYGSSGQLRHAIIGRYGSIAPDVHIGWDEHPSERLTSSMLSYARNIHGWADFCGIDTHAVTPYPANAVTTTIGHDVWIGHGVFVRKGLTIGTGAIIGAGAVITKDVPPYAVMAGNPARLIRMRFDAQTVAALLASQWWRYRYFDIPPEYISQPQRLPDWLARAGLTPYAPQWIDAAWLAELIGQA